MSPSMIATSFPSCLQDISRKSAEKSWSGLFPCWEPCLRGDIGVRKRMKDRREEDCEGGSKRVLYKAMQRDEFGLRVGGFVMPRTCDNP